MSTALQTKILPRSVDPRRLANQGVVLDGVIEPEQCQRLSSAVLEIVAPINVSLSFHINDRGHRAATGSASTVVTMECHRCLGAMSVTLVNELDVEIVWSDDDARSVPKDLDPWVVEEDSADIIELVEEELLLALPIVNYHSEEDCTSAVGYSTMSDGEQDKPDRKNPFEILGQLK